MQEGIFIAASGAMKQMRQLNVLSNNLANLNNVGFKRDQLVFEAMIPPFQDPAGFETARNALLPARLSNLNTAYVVVAGFVTDHSQGGLEKTDNVLDLALQGEGFFRVQTPSGIRYTRKGNFQLDSQGFLVTQNQFQVLGEKDEPLLIPALGRDITIDTEGLVSAGSGLTSVPLGQLKLAAFDDLTALEKQGDGLYKLIDPSQKEQTPKGTTIQQGFLEQSNVKSIEEMTRLIETHRMFEAYQKMIQAIDEVDDRAVNVLARVA